MSAIDPPSFVLDMPEDADDDGYSQAIAVMTLRDVFAAFAMLGYLGSDYDMTKVTRAREAYTQADLMIEARAE